MHCIHITYTKDIQSRTGGDYLGVVGPVRTGKSTFIKRFMDLMVLPYMTENMKKYELRMSCRRVPGRPLLRQNPNLFRKRPQDYIRRGY